MEVDVDEFKYNLRECIVNCEIEEVRFIWGRADLDELDIETVDEGPPW